MPIGWRFPHRVIPCAPFRAHSLLKRSSNETRLNLKRTLSSWGRTSSVIPCCGANSAGVGAAGRACAASACEPHRTAAACCALQQRLRHAAPHQVACHPRDGTLSAGRKVKHAAAPIRSSAARRAGRTSAERRGGGAACRNAWGAVQGVECRSMQCNLCGAANCPTCAEVPWPPSHRGGYSI